MSRSIEAPKDRSRQRDSFSSMPPNCQGVKSSERHAAIVIVGYGFGHCEGLVDQRPG